MNNTFCSFPKNEPCKLVVITGGPGAGKTAVLEMVKKYFCESIIVIPEAASILFSGGFWRTSSIANQKGAQRAIFHIQNELQRIVLEEAVSPVALCDRGTLDSLAYWPDKEEKFWEDVGSNFEKEINKYSAIIHLRTPTETFGYNHQNPLRIEDPVLAKAIDDKIFKIWEKHPKRFVIESTENFIEKTISSLEIIQNELPSCCKRHDFKSILRSP